MHQDQIGLFVTSEIDRRPALQSLRGNPLENHAAMLDAALVAVTGVALLCGVLIANFL
jgi:hypothetical protein